jgi:excisionase family DNA binding protein
MIEPLTVSMQEASRLLGVSRATIYKLMRQGKIESMKLGEEIMQTRRLIVYASLKKLLPPKEEAA